MEYQPDKEFDVIYSSLTFMHIRDKKKAIEKVNLMLKKSGRFVLSVDKNQDSVIDYGIRKIDIFPDQQDTILRYLEESGMNVLRKYETEFAHVFVSCGLN